MSGGLGWQCNGRTEQRGAWGANRKLMLANRCKLGDTGVFIINLNKEILEIYSFDKIICDYFIVLVFGEDFENIEKALKILFYLFIIFKIRG